mmetsp:Transcript_26630/g.58495  ORF Transcript_26630/g.58495 Transcript_26630/m.58495 type:complete len:93 (-) Transcript_26630:3-281(-)
MGGPSPPKPPLREYCRCCIGGKYPLPTAPAPACMGGAKAKGPPPWLKPFGAGGQPTGGGYWTYIRPELTEPEEAPRRAHGRVWLLPPSLETT